MTRNVKPDTDIARTVNKYVSRDGGSTILTVLEGYLVTRQPSRFEKRGFVLPMCPPGVIPSRRDYGVGHLDGGFQLLQVSHWKRLSLFL